MHMLIYKQIFYSPSCDYLRHEAMVYSLWVRLKTSVPPVFGKEKIIGAICR